MNRGRQINPWLKIGQCLTINKIKHFLRRRKEGFHLVYYLLVREPFRDILYDFIVPALKRFFIYLAEREAKKKGRAYAIGDTMGWKLYIRLTKRINYSR